MVGLARNFVRMMRAGLRTQVLRPIRRTRLAKREQPFTHRTPHRLVFHLDPTDWSCQQIYVDGVYDGRFLDWLTRTLDRRGTCLDIGANIGNHRLFLARGFSPVYAIEPDPTAYAQLERNIQANPTLDVRAFQVALSDSSGDALFYDIGSGCLGLSGFAANLTHLDVSRIHYQERRVPHMTDDTLVDEEGIANIALIKIDTEGHEERVIRGLARTIGRDTPVLAFEWHGQFRPRGALAPIRELLDVRHVRGSRRSLHTRAHVAQAQGGVRDPVGAGRCGGAAQLRQHLGDTHGRQGSVRVGVI